MWVRGLKPTYGNFKLVTRASHPMWVRGLKQFLKAYNVYVKEVAPYVGAWIETQKGLSTISSYGRRTLCGCVD